MARIQIGKDLKPYVQDDWGIDEIINQADNDDVKITEAQAIRVLERIVESYDANIGINWEVVSIVIDIVLSEEVSA